MGKEAGAEQLLCARRRAPEDGRQVALVSNRGWRKHVLLTALQGSSI